MQFKTIHRDSTPEKVVCAILAKIRGGHLPPGARLPSQKALADQLGVGRSSIREATNALALMGYIDIQQGRGSFVCVEPAAPELSVLQVQAALSAGDIYDLMEARMLMECQCARWAAERATKRHLRELDEAARKVEARGDDYDGFLEADLSFHMRLAEAGQNSVVVELMVPVIERVHAHHQRYRGAMLMPAVQQRAAASTRRLVDHVRQGRADAAAEEMQRHLQSVIEELKEIVAGKNNPSGI
jgi:GntR family transcriptional repressor for pyruvate dehydrogenase complex